MHLQRRRCFWFCHPTWSHLRVWDSQHCLQCSLRCIPRHLLARRLHPLLPRSSLPLLTTAVQLINSFIAGQPRNDGSSRRKPRPDPCEPQCVECFLPWNDADALAGWISELRGMYTCFRTDYFIVLLFPYFLASKCVPPRRRAGFRTDFALFAAGQFLPSPRLDCPAKLAAPRFYTWQASLHPFRPKTPA